MGFEAWAHNAHEVGMEPEASKPRLFENHGSIFWIPIIRTTGFGGLYWGFRIYGTTIEGSFPTEKPRP